MSRYTILEVRYKTDNEMITVKLFDKDKGEEVYIDVTASDLISMKEDS